MKNKPVVRRYYYAQAIVLACGVIGIMLLWPWGKAIYLKVQLEREIIREVVDLRARYPMDIDLDVVETLAKDSRDNLEGLQQDLEPLFRYFTRFSWLPRLGPYLAEIEPALEFGIQVSLSAEVMAEAVSPFMDLGQGRLNSTGVSGWLDLTEQTLETLEIQLELVRGSRQNVHPAIWPQAYHQQLASFDEAFELLEMGVYTGKDIHAQLVNIVALLWQAEDLSQTPLADIDFEQAARLANQLAASLVQLQHDLQPLFPYIEQAAAASDLGTYLGQLEPALQFAIELSNLGEQLAAAGIPFRVLLDENLSGFDLSRATIGTIADSQPAFDEILAQIDLVEQWRRGLDPGLLPLSYQVEAARLEKALQQLAWLVEDLQYLPAVLGADRPKTYLIMVQNRDELRATGGFITAFGLLRLDEGRISMMVFENSGRLNWVKEVLPAPEPMAAIMFAHYWVARDANWSPDFPTAARQTQELYSLSTGIPTDGVIAFDEQILESFLALSGPIEIPGQNLVISSQNVRQEWINFKEQAPEMGYREKDFVPLFLAPLLGELLSYQQPDQFAEIGQLLLTMIEQGHLLVYLNDGQAQGALARRNLDGKISPGEGDFRMLVDANLGGNKVDQFIQRAVRYQVDLSDLERPWGQIVLNYQHTQPGYEPCIQGRPMGEYPDRHSYFFSRCHWDYWRVYTPAGTQLRAADVPIVPGSYFLDGAGWPPGAEAAPGERGTTVLSGLVVVPQDDSRQVTLEVDLPAQVVRRNEKNNPVYALRVQKQAGLEFLSLEIELILPQGYSPAFSMEGWEAGHPGTYVWSGDIVTTTDFTVELLGSE